MHTIQSICEEIKSNTKIDYYSILLKEYENDTERLDSIRCKLSYETVKNSFIQMMKYKGIFNKLTISSFTDEKTGEEYEAVIGIEWLNPDKKNQLCHQDDETGAGMHYDHNNNEMPLKGYNSINFILD